MARIYESRIEDWLRLAREVKYNEERLADKLQVCPRQLRRRTHAVFGVSPRKLLDKFRLDDAPALLQKYRSVKVVADLLGFKYRSHFSRKFFEYHGHWPVEHLASLWTCNALRQAKTISIGAPH